MDSEQVSAILDSLESARNEVLELKAENQKQAAEIERLKGYLAMYKSEVKAAQPQKASE